MRVLGGPGMVQAPAAADQLRSPLQGERVSASRRSMWPALVLGILTAVIAWFWYRGSGDARTPVTNPNVTSGTEQEVGESKLNAADRESQEVREKKVSQTRNEQQPNLQVHELSDLDHPKSGSEVQSNEATTNVPLTVQGHAPVTPVPAKELLQGDIHVNAVPKENAPHGHIQEQHTALHREEQTQANAEEHPPDVPKEEGQAHTDGHFSNVSKKEEAQADIQGHLTDISKKDDDQTNLMTSVGKVIYVLDEPLQDIVQTNVADPCEEMMEKNDDLQRQEESVHLTDIPEVRGLLVNGDEVYPLKKEVQAGAEDEYTQNDLDRAEVQVNGCSALMSGKPADQSLADSCQASKSEQENGQAKACLHSVVESPDGVYSNGEVNRAKQGAEHASGGLLENSVKGNAMTLLEAKKTLTQDPYLKMIYTSCDDGNAITSVEKSDLKNKSSSVESSTGLQDDSDVSASIFNESTQHGLSKVNITETGPETLPVDIFNQEKETAGLGTTNTVEKISFGSPSEANIHDVDHQKTRKVATIQPMPQNVKFAFKVHYITHSNSQIIAVTGDHEKLGKWETYVPLTCGNGGFWSHSITLPADTNLAWKFVMVEDGKIKRWEECYNRFLKTAHEDIEAHLYWGFP